MKLDVTEGVPDGMLEFTAAELGDKDQRLPAERARLLVVDEESAIPGNIAEHFGLPGLMDGSLEEAERLLVMIEGVGVAALKPGQVREALLGPGLTTQQEIYTDNGGTNQIWGTA